ncbi:MAG: TonB-dependent receptor [Prevotellaceae bacterium]|nr:TonB-dependent receptor [Candidatus Colivivens caballi]
MAVCLLAVTTALAQTRQVKGSVLSATDGEALIGAAVQEVGTSNGTVTDYNGAFTLTVKEGASLKISYVGYTPQTVKAAANLTIRLQEDTKALDDVVVIGYGVQKKSDLTGAVGSIKESDLQNRSMTDAAAAMQGKVAGLQILNMSGAPGETAQIRVRGYSSNGDNLGPLLIVDGLQVSDISYLDPSLIESIEVLKDAASAAIYGVQAGNGVVLITTKKGKSAPGRPTITYNGKVTIQSLNKKAELFEAPEYIEYQKYIGYLSDDLLAANGYNGENYNWFDAVFGTSIATQNGLTFQGGNDQGHFLASFDYAHNNGIIKGGQDVFNRITGQINADYKVNKWLKLTTNNTISKNDRKSVSHQSYGSMLNSVMSLDPLTPAYISDFSDLPDHAKQQQQKYDNWYNAGANAADREAPLMSDPDHNGDYYGLSKYLQESTGNPLAQRDRQQGKNSNFALRGVTSLDITPFKFLTFTSRLGYTFTKGTNRSYSEPYYLTGMASSNTYSYTAANNSMNKYQWENFVNFNKDFGKHNIGAMVGMGYYQTKIDNLNVSANGLDIFKSYADNFRYVDYLIPSGTEYLSTKDFNPDGSPVSKVVSTWSTSNNPTTQRNISYFGRLSYNYDNKYYLQANFRADAYDSSKLFPEERWGYFPSVSAGWTVSNEKFFQENVNTDVFNFLKIRASYGVNGNISNLAAYQYSASVSVNGYWYQNTPGTAPGAVSYGSALPTLPNPNLKWETSKQFDLGIDARFFNDRLTFGFDYYRKVTNDLLTEVNNVPEAGIAKSWINAGEVLNRGFEFEIGWRDMIGDLKYSVNTNFSTLHNEVLEMPEQLLRIEGTQGGVSGLNNQIRTSFETGQPIWYFRGYKSAGVNPETGAPRYYNAAGEIVDNVTANDLQYIGSAIPTFTYGLTINLEYKGFDFTVFGTGVAGNKIFSLLYSADRPKTNTLTTFWRNSWKEAGDNAKYADMKQVSNNWTYWSSDVSMFDGSYFKFKQIQLGYTLPKSLLAKTGFIQGLRAYVSLDDFFTITSYPGCDPETAQTSSARNMGYDCGSYPTTKKVILGLNLSF